jgi:hypothetical protein
MICPKEICPNPNLESDQTKLGTLLGKGKCSE